MGAIFERHKILVSRETIEKLSIYGDLLVKWQKAINLVGPATLEELVTRHFVDSAQVFQYIDVPASKRLADMGSGAGFPGLVLAIMGVGDVHLIESDIRKSTFLREVSRETKTAVTIHDIRIEDCQVPDIDVFSARALAPLAQLLKYADKLRTAGRPAEALFMKGAQVTDELKKIDKDNQYQIFLHDSVTDAEAKIVQIRGL